MKGYPVWVALCHIRTYLFSLAYFEGLMPNCLMKADQK